jgi:hypothetical protein
MRYSLLGIFGLTALVAVLAAAHRAMGTIVAATIIDALLPVILWFILLCVHFESNDNRLSLFRFGLKVSCLALTVAPIVGIFPIEMLCIQLTVIGFFWTFQYVAIVSWIEGT